MAALQNSISDNSFHRAHNRQTKDLFSLFTNPKKVVFTDYGGSKLLCYDQLFAYVVDVQVENDETYFSCTVVIVVEPLPESEVEIKSIKVNADFTSVALVSSHYVYSFMIPDFNKGVVLSRYSDGSKGAPKISVDLLTIGPLLNTQNILKVQWIPSALIHENVQLADFLGVLYYGNIMKIYDTKNPEVVCYVDFTSSVVNSIKEDYCPGGFGLSKIIVSFDFGLVFDGDNPFLTVFAIDPDSELYYCGIVVENSTLKLTAMIGPILFPSKLTSEPVDMLFIKHQESDAFSVFAVAQDNGCISHMVAYPYDRWSNMLKGAECLEFFVYESVELGAHAAVSMTSDQSIEGEYLVCSPRNVVAVSINPWLVDMKRTIKDPSIDPNMEKKSVCCHVFQLINASNAFRSLANLTVLGDEFERYLAVVDSECGFNGKFLPVLWEDLASKKKSKDRKYDDNESPLITENPFPANVPLLENGDEDVMVDLMINVNLALLQTANANTLSLQEALNKANSVKAFESQLISNYDNLFGSVIDLADHQKDIQANLHSQLEAIDKLCARIEKVTSAVPQEKLTHEHVEIEHRVKQQKRRIQENVVNVREAAIKAVLLRSKYYSKQPSFRSSTSAVKFMMTKTDVTTNELKAEVAKLNKSLVELTQVAEYMQKLKL